MIYFQSDLKWLVENNKIVDPLEKCGLFSDFWYGFRSSSSTADLLTIVSGRTARAFNSFGSIQAVALDSLLYNIAIYTDDTALCSRCDQASDL